jgi:toxin ParE1/3/4
MAHVIWTHPALSDLDRIADYIALDHLAAARRLVQNVFSAVERLEQFPESNRVPPELSDSLYREIVLTPCRIFYRYDKTQSSV